MAELLQNLSSSPPSSFYDPSPATATSPNVPFPRSPVPPLRLLPRGDPEHGGGVFNGSDKDTESDLEKEHATTQVAGMVKDVLASFLSDAELKPAPGESVSETVPNPSPGLPAASSEPDDSKAKVFQHQQTERPPTGVEEGGVQHLEIPSRRRNANRSPHASPRTKHVYV